MTITEIMQQAQALTATERKELVKLLVDSLDSPPEQKPDEPEKHWGKDIVRLMDEIGPIELAHPEIEDPVEWVRQIRREESQKRLGNWGEPE